MFFEIMVSHDLGKSRLRQIYVEFVKFLTFLSATCKYHRQNVGVFDNVSFFIDVIHLI